MKADKELYRELREQTCDQLWNVEVPRFNQASPRERLERVALIRAIGVVFAAGASAKQRSEARAWLRGLLHDPQEKIRRYATAALPKIGSGRGEEGALLQLLEKPAGERERRSVGRALEKIGGAATLAAVQQKPGLLPNTEQKVRAAVLRQEQPGRLHLDAKLDPPAGLRINLRCRRGLETIVREEAESFAQSSRLFRVQDTRAGAVALAPAAAFSLGDLYRMRCHAHPAFVLGIVPADDAEAIARAIVSPSARAVFAAFTDGPPRYRLEFIGHGHRRGALREIVGRAYELCPELINDSRRAPWSVDLYAFGRSCLIELRPRFAPDPRMFYRRDDVDAASHPPLAAAMARLAGPFENDVVWDPFCGSGLELVERALLGGVKKLCGTDLDANAISILRANVAAAKLGGIETDFERCDFREFAQRHKPGSISLVITNPPMGRRIRIPDLRGLIADFFDAASRMLRPGGRLVFPNPVRVAPRDPSLRLKFHEIVDLGGFTCRLELYEKTRDVAPAPPPPPRHFGGKSSNSQMDGAKVASRTFRRKYRA